MPEYRVFLATTATETVTASDEEAAEAIAIANWNDRRLTGDWHVVDTQRLTGTPADYYNDPSKPADFDSGD